MLDLKYIISLSDFLAEIAGDCSERTRVYWARQYMALVSGVKTGINVQTKTLVFGFNNQMKALEFYPLKNPVC